MKEIKKAIVDQLEQLHYYSSFNGTSNKPSIDLAEKLVFDDSPRRHGPRVLHGYTYSGHPLACAAAIANLDIVIREDLPAHAAERGASFLQKLAPFVDRYGAVGDVRGKGLMLVIELVKDKATKEPMPADFGQRIGTATRAAGAMVRPAGHKIILSPPLIIDEDEIDIVVKALEQAFYTTDI